MRRSVLLFGLILIPGILLSTTFWLSKQPEGSIGFWDYSYALSPEVDTLEVTYIAWACACANWLPTELLEDPNYNPSDHAEDCLFLEAENSDKLGLTPYQVSGGQKLRLVGRFYEEAGISRDYEKPTSQKPEPSRVFRYSSFQVVD